MDGIVKTVKNAALACLSFFKWVLLAIGVGVTVGAVAAAFHESIGLVTALREAHPWMLWLLPAVGAAIALLYRLCGMEHDRGTNLVLVAIRDGLPVRLRAAPLIFVSSVLTHLAGGSSGREGAALQMGGAMAAWAGRKLKLDERDERVLVMCGMAAAFSALFGTPITAAVFPMEMVSVGAMYYGAFVPCLVSSVSGFLLAQAMGLHGLVGYAIGTVPALTGLTMLQSVGLGALCAVVSVLFCEGMHLGHKLYERYIPNAALRGAVGGALVLILLLVLPESGLYTGAGDQLIRVLLDGRTIWYAFLLKMLLTALTLGAGFRGGEIVPALCVGCAFGTWMGPVLGLAHGFSGALGMAAVFCGATNCPITSLLLSYELFGGEGMVLFALGCAVSYMLSGYYGLYSEQKFVYAKLRAEGVDRNAI